MARVHIPETPLTKALVAAVCSYEVVAIGSQYVQAVPTIPTVTALDRRWPLIGLTIVVSLAVHFWAPAPAIPTR